MHITTAIVDKKATILAEQVVCVWSWWVISHFDVCCLLLFLLYYINRKKHTQTHILIAIIII